MHGVRVKDSYAKRHSKASLLFDTQTDPAAKLAGILALAYPVLPQNPYDAVQGVIDFYTGDGHMTEQTDKGARNVPPCYDLTEDFDYIWGAFMAQYGVDLMECHMHWWKFKALLACLSDDCKFSKIIAYRTVDTAAIRDKELRRFYQKMKKQFRLTGIHHQAVAEDTVADSLEGLF